MSPFQALYGRPPPTIPDYIKGATDHDNLDSTLQLRQQILRELKENLKRSRQRMVEQANNKRRDYTFNVGDRALLRLQPYRQHTVVRRPSEKLAKRYYGPFKILRRVGEVAYELDLPPGTRIHPVVHVSQLRPYFEDDTHSQFTPLPFEILEKTGKHGSFLEKLDEEEKKNFEDLREKEAFCVNEKREEIDRSGISEGNELTYVSKYKIKTSLSPTTSDPLDKNSTSQATPMQSEPLNSKGDLKGDAPLSHAPCNALTPPAVAVPRVPDFPPPDSAPSSQPLDHNGSLCNKNQPLIEDAEPNKQLSPTNYFPHMSADHMQALDAPAATHAPPRGALNLEDKVLIGTGSNDSNLGVAPSRPKRVAQKPGWMEGFV